MSLEEADLEMTNMAMGEGSGFQGRQQTTMEPGDELLFVRFYSHPRHNPDESAVKGRPIFIDTTYVEIMQPGNKENIIKRPAKAKDKQRFARQFQAYNVGEDQMGSGTPLEQWPALSRSQVEELKFFNVVTVEQLAGMNDSNAQNFAGIQSLKMQAKAFLEAASEMASDTTQIVAEVEALQSSLEVANENNAVLLKRLEKLEAKNK